MISLDLHLTFLLSVTRSPVALLVYSLVVFNMGLVLQWLVQNEELSGMLGTR